MFRLINMFSNSGRGAIYHVSLYFLAIVAPLAVEIGTVCKSSRPRLSFVCLTVCNDV